MTTLSAAAPTHYSRSTYLDSKVHGAHMEPTWGRQGPGGPHVGHVNWLSGWCCLYSYTCLYKVALVISYSESLCLNKWPHSKLPNWPYTTSSANIMNHNSKLYFLSWNWNISPLCECYSVHYWNTPRDYRTGSGLLTWNLCSWNIVIKFDIILTKM